MNRHARHPGGEVRPPPVTAQRSTDARPARLHTRDAWPLMKLLKLHVLDLVHEYRCGSPCLNAWRVVVRLDKGHADTAAPGEGLRREPRHAARQLHHPAR